MKYITTLLLVSTLLFFISCGSSETLYFHKQEKAPANPLFKTFGVGFGGGSSFAFNDNNNDSIYVDANDLMNDKNIALNNYYSQIKDFNTTAFTTLQTHLEKSKYFVIWATKGWKESYFNISSINSAISQGQTPVFIYWYFGDTLVQSMPNDNEVKDYYKDAQRFSSFLKKIDGNKLLIIEPEFNKPPVLAQADKFANIMSNSIDILKKENNVTLSLCMVDTGNRGVKQTYKKCQFENCSLGDIGEWSSVKPIYDKLIDKLDFISFQEMLGQFSRNPLNPGTFNEPNPIAFSEDETGIKNLHLRIENLSKYLFDTYKKPLFLPYIGVATATWNDLNNDNKIQENEVSKNGFLPQVDQFYASINKKRLQENHLFGYAVMSLFDEPSHDKNGYQYFMNNEYHLGIIGSSAVDSVDKGINGDLEFKKNILNSLFK